MFFIPTGWGQLTCLLLIHKEIHHHPVLAHSKNHLRGSLPIGSYLAAHLPAPSLDAMADKNWQSDAETDEDEYHIDGGLLPRDAGGIYCALWVPYFPSSRPA